jgi:hypothetical protein
MKTIRFILMATTVLIVASCGSSKQAQQQQQQQYPNYGGYVPQGQPMYYQQTGQGYYQQPQQQPVYQQQYQSQQGPDASGYTELRKSPIEELSMARGTNEIRAYGSAEALSEQLALNAARTQANAALQEKIETYVQSGLIHYEEQTRVNGEPALDQSTRNRVISAAKGVVNGASVLDTRKLYNSNTKMYKYEVCVTYDRAGILSVMQAQSERIRANEKQFEQDMQQAWDELDAQNNRVSLSEQKAARQNEMEQNNLDREHQRNMQYQNQQNQYNLQSQQMNQQYQQQQQQYQQNYQNPQGQQYQQYPQQQYPQQQYQNQYQQYPQGQQY